MITETFKNLDVDKQQRILNAALKEFAEYGYEQASTNRMVKNAEIGKGMLFYYFKNKKELYHYLVTYSIEIIMNQYLSRVDGSEPDFIERMKQAAQIKMKSQAEYPDMFNFIGTVFLSNDDELPEGLATQIKALQKEGYSKLYDNIDPTLFRDDVDVNKVFKLIQWSIEGYQNELIKQLQGKKMTEIDVSPLWDEFYEYMEILKKSFYK